MRFKFIKFPATRQRMPVTSGTVAHPPQLERAADHSLLDRVLNLLNSQPQVYKLLNVLSGIFIFSIGKHFLTYGNWCRFFLYFLSTQQHVNEAFRL